MILFEKDWDKYPEAMVHNSTTNTSFIHVAQLYRKMNIKNHVFLLALHDSSLEHVDPHDEDLDEDTISKIVVECTVNQWYYYREVARAPGVSGSVAMPFKADRGNIAILWLHSLHITTLHIQIRQTGKSFLNAIEDRYLMNIVGENIKINLLTKDTGLRVKTVQLLKDVEKALPAYLRFTNKKVDSDNMQDVTVKALGNYYLTHVAQNNEVSARNIGRGFTSPVFRTDETSYINFIDISLSSALASTGAARDIAEENDGIYFNAHSTTAGRLNTRSGKYVYSKLYTKSAKWTEHMFDCTDKDELKQLIRKNAPGGGVKVIVEMNHRQLGKTDEWLREKISEAEAEGDDVEADYLNIWTSGSKKGPIPKDLVYLLNDSIMTSNDEVTEYGYILRWYISENEIRNYKSNRSVMLSLDTSEAIGNDDIALILSDIRDGSVIAAGEYNNTNIGEFADWILTFFLEFRFIVGIIERRSTGVTIIDNLTRYLPQYNIDPFKVLFNWVVNESDDNPDKFEKIDIPLRKRDSRLYSYMKKEFGYATSGVGKSSRDKLYGKSLLPAIKHTGGVVRDSTLVKQLTTLTMKNGRLDHSTGNKDDMVIAWLLGYWWLVNGNNMSYYNINSDDILSLVSSNDTNETDEEFEYRMEQEETKKEIGELLEVLVTERNQGIIYNINRKIEYLTSTLSESTMKSFNVNQMLAEINEKRKRQ